MNEELYKENILDHNRNPHNKYELEVFDMKQGASNPSCGDTLTLYIKFNGDEVTHASFTGEGCAISQAASSMLTDHLKGMSLDKLKLITPGDLYNMLGVTISPGRVNCALLAYNALSKGIKEYKI